MNFEKLGQVVVFIKQLEFKALDNFIGDPFTVL